MVIELACRIYIQLCVEFLKGLPVEKCSRGQKVGGLQHVGSRHVEMVGDCGMCAFKVVLLAAYMLRVFPGRCRILQWTYHKYSISKWTEQWEAFRYALVVLCCMK